MAEKIKQTWWKEAVVYQVYPASFKSTGAGSRPGWGDVNGVTSKLDYLKHLGVDVVWLSPIMNSPQADMGYDISDYKDIDPLFGSLADVDHMIAELKKRDMKYLVDVVVNHSSDQHPWFRESRSSKDNPKRNWYHWHAGKTDKDGNRQPPNNWAMTLGEAHSAWKFDELTDEYYLALFTPAAVHDVLEFWLERGCSGFRMDVINLISKVEGYPDAPIIAPDHKYQPGYKHYANGPHLNEYLREIRTKVLDRYDCMTVGEMPFVRNEEEILKVVGQDEKRLSMIFVFEIVDIDNTPGSYRMTLHDFDANDIRRCQTKWQRLMIERNGWNSVFIENHDNARSVSRYTDDSDEWRERGAKLLSLMQTTLSGTLFVYQGEEIGMRDVPPSWAPEEYLDVESINYWNKMLEMHPNDEDKLAFGRKVLQMKARDNARTPMQWTAEPNAGFCPPDVKPWMRINDDYKTINVEAQAAQQTDPNKLSVLQFWKRGLANRKQHKAVFVYGDFEALDEKESDVFAYKRASKDEAFVVVLNFSNHEVQWELPGKTRVEKWAATTYDGVPEKATSGTVTLGPWEGLLGVAQP